MKVSTALTLDRDPELEVTVSGTVHFATGPEPDEQGELEDVTAHDQTGAVVDLTDEEEEQVEEALWQAAYAGREE